MQNATQVAHAAVDMKIRSHEMAQGSERVAMDALTVATASEEMSATSNDIASNCVRAVESSQQTSPGSGWFRGCKQYYRRHGPHCRASACVSSYGWTPGEKSNQIGTIVGTIQDIGRPDQPAGPERSHQAARAGEQGRGFAVVADEVRALAERTTKATREISDMIKSIQSETNGAVEAMNQGVKESNDGTSEAAKSGAALQQILSQVDEVTQDQPDSNCGRRTDRHDR